MTIILTYIAVMVVVVALIYALVVVVFGRSEDIPPLTGDSTPTSLPAGPITSADVGALRFQQVVRGYKPAEVDWALAELGAELDRLRARLSQTGEESERAIGGGPLASIGLDPIVPEAEIAVVPRDQAPPTGELSGLVDTPSIIDRVE